MYKTDFLKDFSKSSVLNKQNQRYQFTLGSYLITDHELVKITIVHANNN